WSAGKPGLENLPHVGHDTLVRAVTVEPDHGDALPREFRGQPGQRFQVGPEARCVLGGPDTRIEIGHREDADPGPGGLAALPLRERKGECEVGNYGIIVAPGERNGT